MGIGYALMEGGSGCGSVFYKLLQNPACAGAGGAVERLVRPHRLRDFLASKGREPAAKSVRDAGYLAGRKTDRGAHFDICCQASFTSPAPARFYRPIRWPWLDAPKLTGASRSPIALAADG